MATSVRLSPEIEQRIELLATQTGRSKDFYRHEVIKRGIEDVEDYYLAIQVLERVQAGKERVYSSEEVKQRLGLEVL